mgnify:CR=1 FL=1
MPDAQHLVLFIAAGLLLNLTPGPDVLYIISNALRSGVKAGVVAGLGITAGCFVHVFAAALGVSALMAASADPSDLASRWAAARLLSEKIPGGAPRAAKAVETALERAPANVFLLARLSELARNAGDVPKALAVHDRLRAVLEGRDPKLDGYLDEARQALASNDARTASHRSPRRSQTSRWRSRSTATAV